VLWENCRVTCKRMTFEQNPEESEGKAGRVSRRRAFLWQTRQVGKGPEEGLCISSLRSSQESERQSSKRGRRGGRAPGQDSSSQTSVSIRSTGGFVQTQLVGLPPRVSYSASMRHAWDSPSLTSSQQVLSLPNTLGNLEGRVLGARDLSWQKDSPIA
jgi:hypothetical protein